MKNSSFTAQNIKKETDKVVKKMESQDENELKLASPIVFFKEVIQRLIFMASQKGEYECHLHFDDCEPDGNVTEEQINYSIKKLKELGFKVDYEFSIFSIDWS